MQRVNEEAKLNVQLLTWTPNPEDVITVAAKLCYSPSSINELIEKQTPESAEKFINMLKDLGHDSPTEHVSFTFGIEGISRSLTHQLVRHRIASYSQQSQRYVKEGQFKYVIPKEIANNKKAANIFIKNMRNIQKSYDEIVDCLLENYINDEINNNFSEMEKTILNHVSNKSRGLPYEKILLECKDENDELNKLYNKHCKDLEKKAIENARYVLPNACETKILLTMNARSLNHFFNERCCLRAQDEIRVLANEMLKQVKYAAPTLFENSGAKCRMLGYCPEGKMGCGLYPTKEQVF